MYIFELGDMVYYSGDYSDPKRNRRSLAIIDKIDESKFPWVGVRMFPSNEFISVRYNYIRSIETKPAHLIKLGFQKKESPGKVYFEKDGIYISDIFVVISPNHFYIPKFRILPDHTFTIDLKKYLKEGKENEIDNDKFNQDFPDANNLNHLLRTFQSMGVATPPIEDFDELMPNY